MTYATPKKRKMLPEKAVAEERCYEMRFDDVGGAAESWYKCRSQVMWRGDCPHGSLAYGSSRACGINDQTKRLTFSGCCCGVKTMEKKTGGYQRPAGRYASCEML
jgi:hypothetical protein